MLLTTSITTLAWYHQKSIFFCATDIIYLVPKRRKRQKIREKQGDNTDKLENNNILFPTLLNSLESKRLHILYCNARAEEK